MKDREKNGFSLMDLIIICSIYGVSYLVSYWLGGGYLLAVILLIAIGVLTQIEFKHINLVCGKINRYFEKH